MANEATVQTQVKVDRPISVGPYTIKACFPSQEGRIVALADDDHGKQVVVKGAQSHGMGRDMLFHELRLLLALNNPRPHPYISHLGEPNLLTDSTGRRDYLVLMFGGNETLNQIYLREEYRRNLQGSAPSYLGVALVQLANALAFMHEERGIVHGDVKPNNALANGTIKAIDLENGDWYSFRAHPNRDGWQATPRFASPQQMNGNPPTPKDDVYSYGATSWVVLKGERTAAPYHPIFIPERIAREKRDLHPLDFKRPRFSERDFEPYGEFGAKLFRALSADPKERPTALELYEAGRKMFGERLPDVQGIYPIDSAVRTAASPTSPRIYVAGSPLEARVQPA